MLLSLLAAARLAGTGYGLSDAVFEDLKSTGNLNLITNPEVRRGIAVAYAWNESEAVRITESSERINSRLSHLLAGHGVRIAALRQDVDPSDWGTVAADPQLVAEVNREHARLSAVVFYMTRAHGALEDFLSLLDHEIERLAVGGSV